MCVCGGAQTPEPLYGDPRQVKRPSPDAKAACLHWAQAAQPGCSPRPETRGGEVAGTRLSRQGTQSHLRFQAHATNLGVPSRQSAPAQWLVTLFEPLRALGSQPGHQTLHFTHKSQALGVRRTGVQIQRHLISGKQFSHPTKGDGIPPAPELRRDRRGGPVCGLAPRRAPRQVLPVTWKLKGTTGAADGHEVSVRDDCRAPVL